MQAEPEARRRSRQQLRVLLAVPLLCIACIACATFLPEELRLLSPRVDQGTLTPGQQVEIPLSANAQLQIWHITGFAGLPVTVYAASPAIYQVALYSPDGTRLAVDSREDDVPAQYHLSTVFPQSGDYRLEIQIWQLPMDFFTNADSYVLELD